MEVKQFSQDLLSKEYPSLLKYIQIKEVTKRVVLLVFASKYTMLVVIGITSVRKFQQTLVAQLDAHLTGDQKAASLTLARSAAFFRGVCSWIIF